MLHYRRVSSCSGSAYEAWTESGCSGNRNPVQLSSPTIQAVVAYAKKNGLRLQKHD